MTACKAIFRWEHTVIDAYIYLIQSSPIRCLAIDVSNRQPDVNRLIIGTATTTDNRISSAQWDTYPQTKNIGLGGIRYHEALFTSVLCPTSLSMLHTLLNFPSFLPSFLPNFLPYTYLLPLPINMDAIKARATKFKIPRPFCQGRVVFYFYLSVQNAVTPEIICRIAPYLGHSPFNFSYFDLGVTSHDLSMI